MLEAGINSKYVRNNQTMANINMQWSEFPARMFQGTQIWAGIMEGKFELLKVAFNIFTTN